MEVAPPDKTARSLQRRKALLEILGPYLEERLLPAMGIESARPELSVPRTGERSLLVFARAGGRDLVVRCFPRRSGRVRTMRSMRHARGRGVRTPAILHVDASRAARRALGCSLLVEERVPGRHPSEFPDRDRVIGIVAPALSRMHNATRSRWGNLRIGRRGGYLDRMVRTLENHLRRSTSLGSDLEETLGARIRRRMEGFRGAVGRIRRFSLTHRAIGVENVLITPEEELVLIDVGRLSYEHFAANLVRALLAFTEGEEERSLFLESYFDAAEGRTMDDYREWEDFFRLQHLVRLEAWFLAKKLRPEMWEVPPDRLRALLAEIL